MAVELILNRGTLRLGGKSFSTVEGEIEKCSMVTVLRPEVTQSGRSLVTGASLCFYHSSKSCYLPSALGHAGPCCESRGQPGTGVLTPRAFFLQRQDCQGHEASRALLGTKDSDGH